MDGTVIEAVFAEHYGRAVASLIRLLHRTGRTADAAAAYDAAISLATNDIERAHLQRRRSSLGR
ncbi:hypothetical protein ACIA5E_29850 [Nocardia asteroides]|uniref:hypothetical protein n=1 Tax=Nocardia asteroides TaxID=1824 RepID=UPI0037AB649C